jgi:MFS family permease
MARVPRLGQAWTLWLAAALAVVGGIAPLVFGGMSSRIDAALIPFWIGAAIFAACAFLPNQSRGVTAILYFVGGLAIVYGLLSMFSLPVRLAVLGTCPAPPARCTTGLPTPMTNGENTGMGVASVFGVLAIFLGFYGLVTVYRKSAVNAESPPTRQIPPVAPRPAPQPVGVAAAVTHERAAREEPELELPAPEELPELPPHESESSTN